MWYVAKEILNLPLQDYVGNDKKHYLAIRN